MPPSTEQVARRYLARLERRLEARRPSIDLYENYRDGEHRLAFATSKFREAFGNLFGELADNWCEVVVEATAERLAVEGFRFGTDANGDERAWDIWQENGLDAESGLAHDTAITCGESYALVEPRYVETAARFLGRRRATPATPRVTIEHPAEFIVETAVGDRRQRLAALKIWLDGDGKTRFANVYLPDSVWKFRSVAGTVSSDPRIVVVTSRPETAGWELYEVPTPNPLGIVPGVPLYNRPTLRKGGRSDLVCVIPMQDAVNKLFADLLVNSEFAAFPQRWATGIEKPRDPDTDEEIAFNEWVAAISRVWTNADPDSKFGSFEVSDLGNYVKAIEMTVQHIAAQTRTPPHYLLGQSGAFPSGESLKATETGLVAKVGRKQLSFGDGWEDTIRLCFTAIGDTKRAGELRAETIWKDAESRSEAEHVDALSKLSNLGVPREALWERYGASQEEIRRWKLMADEEAKRAATLGFGAFNPDPAAQNGGGE